MQILIVEDDERVAAALEAFLARSGYASVRAADGASALQLLGADTEVVLLDLGLPDVDGIDLCRRIRGRSEVPIVIVTARNQVTERIRGLRAGADDFVVKPYDVHSWLASRRLPDVRDRCGRSPKRVCSCRMARWRSTSSLVRCSSCLLYTSPSPRDS